MYWAAEVWMELTEYHDVFTIKVPLQPYDIGQGIQNRGAHCRTFQPMPGLCNRNKESHDKTAFVNGLSWLFSYRSGETRTRGLLLPKQARYQLRNTPASGGTAVPPEYSISFFARFVNTESAADGAARSAFFSRQKRQQATAEKGAVAGAFMETGGGFGATAKKQMQKLYRVQNLLHSSCKLAGKVLS